MKGKLIIGKSAQEIFDTVVVHLMHQGWPSYYKCGGAIDGTIKACAYRGEEGRKCAAGILITDDEYRGIEGCSWEDMVNKHGFTDEHKSLIQNLQMVHDRDVDNDAIDKENYDIGVWHDTVLSGARHVASMFSLNTDALERAYKEYA